MSRHKFPLGNNEGGRTVDDEWIKRIARKYCPEAFNVLIDNLKDEDAATRQKAAESILNRGYGKPKEQVEAKIEAIHGWRAIVKPKS